MWTVVGGWVRLCSCSSIRLAVSSMLLCLLSIFGFCMIRNDQLDRSMNWLHGTNHMMPDAIRHVQCCARSMSI